jgi:type IV pilus assembly protein PilB
VTPNEEYILELLQDAGMVTGSQIAAARDKAAQEGAGVIAALISLGNTTEEDVTRTVAAASNMEFVDLSQMLIRPEILELISRDKAYRYGVVPVSLNDDVLVVAISDPLNFDTLDNLRFLLKREIEMVCATPEQIKQSLVKYYGSAEEAGDLLMEGLGQDDIVGYDKIASDESDSDSGDSAIIKLVSMLLLEAYKIRASDIHLEPLEKRFRVRFRIDGMLQEMHNPPKKLQSAIVSRLKIMSGTMSIAEKRLPQDGRIQVKMGKKSIDLRVSTLPTNHGESVVMRILDKSSLSLGLPELGFLTDDQAIFEHLITLPDGILLVTGPTGSGKTTTLYACLNYINRPDRKIITVEDPVEYQMSGINQVQVVADIGMTFPAALRSMLRQAPNIIMIGEIRDLETASIAINASLTGHLVFSTLHTNDAPGAVARLVDMGIKPFLVATSTRAILAQRLVRKLCNKCKQPAELTELEMKSLYLEPGQLDNANAMQPVGCEACRNKGFKGRMGIFEIFQINDEVRFMINDRLSTMQLRQRARELGMRTMREDGIRKVLNGMTTAEEVISTTMGDAH